MVTHSHLCGAEEGRASGIITLKAGPIRWPGRPSPSGCPVSSRP